MLKYAIVFAFAMLSSAGLPLLNGFVGEFTIMQGAFEANKIWAVFAVTGVILGAAYLLWLYQRTMLGQVTNGKNLTIPDMTAREVALFLPLIAWAIWIGIYPKPYFEILRQPVAEIVERVRPGRIGGGDLADTVADHERRAHAPAPPQLHQRDLQGENRRLRDVGLAHAGFRRRPAHLSEERPARQRLEAGIDRLEHLPHHRLALQQLPAHAPPLRPLPGKHEHERAAHRAPSGYHALGRAVLPPCGQAAAHVRDAVADDGQPVRVVLTARTRRRAHLGQRVRRALQQLAIRLDGARQRGLVARGDRQHSRTGRPRVP